MLIRRPLITTLFPYTTLFRSAPFSRRFRGRDRRRRGDRDRRRLPFPRPQQADEEEAHDRTPGRHQADQRVAIEPADGLRARSEVHTSELQSLAYIVCRRLLE